MKRKEFDACIQKNELIETGDKDTALAQELLKLTIHRQQFWKEVNLENKYPSLYLEGHYEIIKELATAVLALEGWKALNHECLFAYLKEKRQDTDVDFAYLLDLKDLRNAIDYRGVSVSTEMWKQNKMKIQLTIKALTNYVQNRILER